MTKSVLLVDDRASVVRTLGRHVSNEFEVALAYSAEEALQQMEQSKFDVVVTDLSMPGKSGWELIAEAKSRWPETAFIVLSGNLNMAEEELDVQQSVSELLCKPCPIKCLMDAIHSACETASGKHAHLLANSVAGGGV